VYEVVVLSPRQTAGTGRFLVSTLVRLPQMLLDPSSPVLPPSTLVIWNLKTRSTEATYWYSSSVEDSGSMRMHETALRRDLAGMSAEAFRRAHLNGIA
jgi:hypothetical protein